MEAEILKDLGISMDLYRKTEDVGDIKVITTNSRATVIDVLEVLNKNLLLRKVNDEIISYTKRYGQSIVEVKVLPKDILTIEFREIRKIGDNEEEILWT